MNTAVATGPALEALQRLLADPTPRVLFGTKAAPGVFAGAGKKDKDAAKECVDEGWLAGTGEHVGKGKSQKEKYRLTPKGVAATLAQGDAAELLESLVAGLDGVKFRVEKLEDILSELKPLRAELAQFHEAVRKLEARLQPPDLEALLRKLGPPARPALAADLSTPPRLDWLETVVRLAQEQQGRNSLQRLTLPQLFTELRKQRPALGLAEFHDGLRQLQEQGRVRLGPYTQALATLDDPRNALYLDREVKFYVEPR